MTQIHPLDEPEDQAVEAGQAEGDAELPLMLDEEAVTASESATNSEPSAAAGVDAPLATGIQPSTPVISLVGPVAAPEVVTAAPVQAAGEALVTVVYIADCWTQLTDANGKVLFSALKRKGETLQLAGKLPLELRLGFARGAQVSLNGSPVDVAPFISGETARLKLGGQ